MAKWEMYKSMSNGNEITEYVAETKYKSAVVTDYGTHVELWEQIKQIDGDYWNLVNRSKFNNVDVAKRRAEGWLNDAVQ